MQEKKVRTLMAVVVASSGDKSIWAAINYKTKHPKYGKYIRCRTKLGVHDEHNQAGVGDVIEVAQCRPYSKTKSWRLVKIINKAVK